MNGPLTWNLYATDSGIIVREQSTILACEFLCAVRLKTRGSPDVG